MAMTETQERKETMENLGKQDENGGIQQKTSASIREDMVNTAVAFLQNPKVRQSPFAQRKAFLDRKGLTADEIEAAIQKSGTAGDENALSAKPINNIVAVNPQPLAVVPQVSVWAKIREAMSVAVFISGASYGIYQIYQVYLAPKFFGKKLREDSEFEKIANSVDELRKSMTEVVANIVELQRQLTASHEQMVSVIKTNIFQKGSPDLGLMNISELKDEIKSVKSLLLSRSQFPPTPSVAPVIPAWQLQRSVEAAKKTDNSAVILPHSLSDQILAKDNSVEADSETVKTADSDKPAEVVESRTASNGVIEDKRDLSDASNKEFLKNGEIVLTDSVSDSKSVSVVDGSTVTTSETSNGDGLSNDG